jgi:hypothetical protein
MVFLLSDCDSRFVQPLCPLNRSNYNTLRIGVVVMVELRVIDGVQKEKPNYAALFSTAYTNTLALASMEDIKEFKDIDLSIRRKILLLGVKMINATKSDNESRGNRLELFSFIKIIAGTLTPREFQTVFPIVKDYDGEKYEVKDYFFTKKYIEDLGEDVVIGEKISEFLWDYHNWEVSHFLVDYMSVLSDMNRSRGGKGFAQEFFGNQGVPIQTMYEDTKGEKFFINEQGKVTKAAKKKRTRHLKALKKETND